MENRTTEKQLKTRKQKNKYYNIYIYGKQDNRETNESKPDNREKQLIYRHMYGKQEHRE